MCMHDGKRHELPCANLFHLDYRPKWGIFNGIYAKMLTIQFLNIPYSVKSSNLLSKFPSGVFYVCC